MAAYIIAHMTIKDPVQWRKYVQAVPGTITAFGGEPVFSGQVMVVYEGPHCSQLTMVLKFPNLNSLESWYASPEYQAIIPFRTAGADVQIIAYEEVNLGNSQ
jgi:uncharacterized protein (DUF1330 family)